MTLHTRIPIQECKARLLSSIDVEHSWNAFAGSKPILGKLDENCFRLRKRIYYRNSFAPLFYGRFVTSEDGTLIEGEFRIRRFATTFLIVWLSFVAGASVTLLVASLSARDEVQNSPIADLAGLAVMALFGFLLIRSSRGIRRNDEKAIVEFLERTFCNE